MRAGVPSPVGPPRRERFPGGFEAWLVTRYDDTRAVLADLRLSRRRPGASSDNGVRGTSLLESDPPQHTELRRAVMPEFSGRAVARLRPYVEKHALELVDGFRDRGSAELVAEYALPLTVAAMCAYVGIPLEDAPRFHRSVLDVHSMDGRLVREATVALDAYLDEVVRSPDLPADSVLGRMVERSAQRSILPHDDLVAMGRSLLVGGYESTKSLIATAALFLAAHPERQRSSASDPAGVPACLEEVLRESPPFPRLQERYALEDLELGGVGVPAGAAIVVDLEAANRDPGRGERQQLAFGPGLHHCPGAGLARMEAEVAVRTLLSSLPGFRLDRSAFVLGWPGGIVAGPSTVPVLF